MKKLISACLALVLTFAIATPAFAADTSVSDMDSSVIAIEGESATLYYHTEGDYIEVGKDIVSRQGDEVFLNDVKIATITTTVDLVPDAVEPRTGWVYGGSNCPLGYSPSDYSSLYSTKTHNVTFEKAVAECGRDIILACLTAIVKFKEDTTAMDVFRDVVDAIMRSYSALTNPNCVYAKEWIYAGGMPYTHKNVFDFYGDRALSSSKYIETTICYSGWA